MFINNVHISERNVQTLDKLVTDVVKLLILKGKKISTAESCTGGLLSQLITSVSGASEIFELGLCTYASSMKHKYLNVPNEEIEKYGVVSEQVALSMAKGLKEISGADVCVSVTGVAGPGGGTAEKPVGTVFVGVICCEKALVFNTALYDADYDREAVRFKTACMVFETVHRLLLEGVD